MKLASDVYVRRVFEYRMYNALWVETPCQTLTSRQGKRLGDREQNSFRQSLVCKLEQRRFPFLCTSAFSSLIGFSLLRFFFSSSFLLFLFNSSVGFCVSFPTPTLCICMCPSHWSLFLLEEVFFHKAPRPPPSPSGISEGGSISAFAWISTSLKFKKQTRTPDWVAVSSKPEIVWFYF